MSNKRISWVLAVGLLILLFSPVLGAEKAGQTEHEAFVPPIWSVIPFIGILMSIAIVPLINAHWWENNFGKISAFWIVVSYLFMYLSLDSGQHFFSALPLVRQCRAWNSQNWETTRVPCSIS